MNGRERRIVEWFLFCLLVCGLVWLVTGLVACSSPPVVEVQSPGRGAASDATLTLGAWTVHELAGPSGPVWIVLPGDLVHRVKGEAPPPTTAVAAQGAAGVSTVGWPWWPWLTVAVVLAVVAAGWWWPRGRPAQ